ncbi:unnamed protein product, partial [Ilex paraguariensis]
AETYILEKEIVPFLEGRGLPWLPSSSEGLRTLGDEFFLRPCLSPWDTSVPPRGVIFLLRGHAPLFVWRHKSQDSTFRATTLSGG